MQSGGDGQLGPDAETERLGTLAHRSMSRGCGSLDFGVVKTQGNLEA